MLYLPQAGSSSSSITSSLQLGTIIKGQLYHLLHSTCIIFFVFLFFFFYLEERRRLHYLLLIFYFLGYCWIVYIHSRQKARERSSEAVMSFQNLKSKNIVRKTPFTIPAGCSWIETKQFSEIWVVPIEEYVFFAIIKIFYNILLFVIHSTRTKYNYQ